MSDETSFLIRRKSVAAFRAVLKFCITNCHILVNSLCYGIPVEDIYTKGSLFKPGFHIAVKADFHSPISGARATFSERHFAITWCVSNYTSVTPTQNEGLKIQSFAAYSNVFSGGKANSPPALKAKIAAVIVRVASGFCCRNILIFLKVEGRN